MNFSFPVVGPKAQRVLVNLGEIDSFLHHFFYNALVLVEEFETLPAVPYTSPL